MIKAVIGVAAINLLLAVAISAQQKSGSPADNLPDNIRRITWFGERVD